MRQATEDSGFTAHMLQKRASPKRVVVSKGKRIEKFDVERAVHRDIFL